MKTLDGRNLEAAGAYYEKCAQSLKARIMALIPKHPEILDMKDSFELFTIPNFICGDLDPTKAMADVALAHAKFEYKNPRTIDSDWEA